MKKLVSVLLALVIVSLSFSINAFAVTPAQTVVSQSTEYLEDGSYIVTTLTTTTQSNISLLSTTYTKTSTKFRDYYDDESNICWEGTLTCTFSYDGSTSRCLSASTGYTIYNTSWRCTSNTASRSGNTGYGHYTFKKYILSICVVTYSPTLTMVCSPSGSLT
jgi:hypothetical protein